MCNNNLAAPQRKIETSIFLWKSRHGGRLAGSSGTKLIGDKKHWRDFSIYRETDVLFQLKIRGASEKFKNQPRPLLRPRYVHFCQHFWNLSHETVPLRWCENLLPCCSGSLRSVQDARLYKSGRFPSGQHTGIGTEANFLSQDVICRSQGTGTGQVMMKVNGHVVDLKYWS